jgi:hypothetical protein
MDAANPSGRPTLTVVAPCYNEAAGIETFYRQVRDVLDAMPRITGGIVFVDDGSTDATLEKLNAIAAHDPTVEVYSLSRNFGHQVALSAGLDVARGDAVLMMDADLQHPPSLIPELVRRWQSGFDVVSAVRRTTSGASMLKRVTAASFYWLINRLSDIEIVPDAADFCLLSRRAHEALVAMPEHHRFLRGMVSWIGFPRARVAFDAPERPAGQSKYTFLRMMGSADAHRLAHGDAARPAGPRLPRVRRLPLLHGGRHRPRLGVDGERSLDHWRHAAGVHRPDRRVPVADLRRNQASAALRSQAAAPGRRHRQRRTFMGRRAHIQELTHERLGDRFADGRR